jgi:hypothetical protein
MLMLASGDFIFQRAPRETNHYRKRPVVSPGKPRKAIELPVKGIQCSIEQLIPALA